MWEPTAHTHTNTHHIINWSAVISTISTVFESDWQSVKCDEINLQAAGAGLSRPSMKQRRTVVTVIIPLGAMSTGRRTSRELTKYTTPAHAYILMVPLVFFCNLWLPNWGQEAHYCIMAGKLQTLLFDHKLSLHRGIMQRLDFFMWACGPVRALLRNWCTDALGSYCLLGLSSIFMLSGLIIVPFLIYSTADSDRHTFFASFRFLQNYSILLHI